MVKVKFGSLIVGVSEDGVYLEQDPEKIVSLADIEVPRSKTEVKAFLGLIRHFKSRSPTSPSSLNTP